MDTNVLYYGDNLDILRKYIDDESVDLIYIDPPFNSQKAYNVIFSEPNGTSSQAQIRAFDDTWHWAEQTEQTYSEIIDTAPPKVVECIKSFRSFLGETDMMAYLTMMTIRLIELHQVLKPTGSFYLHCDPVASHYLKVVLDQIFGVKNFRNEIIWHYRKWPTGKYTFQRNHDVILFYSRTTTRNRTFNQLFMERAPSTLKRFGKGKIISAHDDTGKRLPSQTDDKESEGVRQDDVWDISRVPPIKQLFPTQKPRTLLERIIEASSTSNEGDVVLDAFAGCGTAIVAAQRLNRRWIGIDITHLAIALIKNRLHDAFGDEVEYDVVGEPKDVASARALALQDRYQFQWWALSLIKARPVAGKKKGADAGVDGVIYFQDADPDKPKKAITQKVVVQVKSGKVSVKDIRELQAVIENQKAVIGVFITLENPTKPMVTEAVKAGYYERWGQKYPKIQIRTIEELLQGKGIEYPRTTIDISFKKAEKVETIQEIQPELDLS